MDFYSRTDPRALPQLHFSALSFRIDNPWKLGAAPRYSTPFGETMRFRCRLAVEGKSKRQLDIFIIKLIGLLKDRFIFNGRIRRKGNFGNPVIKSAHYPDPQQVQSN
jgi:hypothetical protein